MFDKTLNSSTTYDSTRRNSPKGDSSFIDNKARKFQDFDHLNRKSDLERDMSGKWHNSEMDHASFSRSKKKEKNFKHYNYMNGVQNETIDDMESSSSVSVNKSDVFTGYGVPEVTSGSSVCKDLELGKRRNKKCEVKPFPVKEGNFQEEALQYEEQDESAVAEKRKKKTRIEKISSVVEEVVEEGDGLIPKKKRKKIKKNILCGDQEEEEQESDLNWLISTSETRKRSKKKNSTAEEECKEGDEDQDMAVIQANENNEQDSGQDGCVDRSGLSESLVEKKNTKRKQRYMLDQSELGSLETDIGHLDQEQNQKSGVKLKKKKKMSFSVVDNLIPNPISLDDVSRAAKEEESHGSVSKTVKKKKKKKLMGLCLVDDIQTEVPNPNLLDGTSSAGKENECDASLSETVILNSPPLVSKRKRKRTLSSKEGEVDPNKNANVESPLVKKENKKRKVVDNTNHISDPTEHSLTHTEGVEHQAKDVTGPSGISLKTKNSDGNYLGEEIYNGDVVKEKESESVHFEEQLPDSQDAINEDVNDKVQKSPSIQKKSPNEESPSVQKKGPNEESPSIRKKSPNEESPSVQKKGPNEESPSIRKKSWNEFVSRQKKGPNEESPSVQKNGPNEESPSIRKKSSNEESPSVQKKGPNEESPSIRKKSWNEFVSRQKKGPNEESPSIGKKSPNEKFLLMQKNGPNEESPSIQKKSPSEESPSIRKKSPNEKFLLMQKKGPNEESLSIQKKSWNEEFLSMQKKGPNEKSPSIQKKSPSEESPSIRKKSSNEKFLLMQKKGPNEESPSIRKKSWNEEFLSMQKKGPNEKSPSMQKNSPKVIHGNDQRDNVSSMSTFSASPIEPKDELALSTNAFSPDTPRSGPKESKRKLIEDLHSQVDSQKKSESFEEKPSVDFLLEPLVTIHADPKPIERDVDNQAHFSEESLEQPSRHDAVVKSEPFDEDLGTAEVLRSNLSEEDSTNPEWELHNKGDATSPHTQGQDEEVFECQSCSKKFSRAKYLRRHLLTHTPTSERSLTCKVCDKQYLSRRSFILHRKTHTTKNFKCEECGETFFHRRHVISHAAVAHGIAAVKCDLCDLQFSSKKAFNGHLTTHVEKKHECTICFKTFPYYAHLDQHMASHELRKTHSYACELCPKTYKSRQNLHDHLRSHGEKNWECTQCDRKFYLIRQLQSHMVIHTEQRPFECEICGKTFKRKADRRSHKWFHRKDQVPQIKERERRQLTAGAAKLVLKERSKDVKKQITEVALNTVPVSDDAFLKSESDRSDRKPGELLEEKNVKSSAVEKDDTVYVVRENGKGVHYRCSNCRKVYSGSNKLLCQRCSLKKSKLSLPQHGEN